MHTTVFSMKILCACVLKDALLISLSHYHFCRLSCFQHFSQLSISVPSPRLTGFYSVQEPARARLKLHASHKSTAKCLKGLTDLPLSVSACGCGAGESRRRSAVCSGVRPSFSLNLKCEHAQHSGGCPSPSETRLSSSEEGLPQLPVNSGTLHLQHCFRLRSLPHCGW